MQSIRDGMMRRAEELLADGTVDRVLGWKAGEFHYDPTPDYFAQGDGLQEMVYNGFCAANLSKYLVQAAGEPGKVLVFLKPCDTYSYNQLLKEHRVNRDKAHLIGVGCNGMLDMNKIRAKGIKGIAAIGEEGDRLIVKTFTGEETLNRGELLQEKCLSCKGKQHMVCDEEIGEGQYPDVSGGNRFAEVEKLEAMPPDQRFAFWRGELSRCIRCNACRNICPACTCIQCVFDNPDSGVDTKANTDSFEENMFHIIRAFHVAGRCTDCGECSRACPQGIPLHLLNRKFIGDINEFYGDYQAGADPEACSPLVEYTKEDVEPGIVHARGGAK